MRKPSCVQFWYYFSIENFKNTFNYLIGVNGVKTTVVCPVFIRSTGMFGDVITKESRLTPDDVADRVILGLEREDIIVMIPTRWRYLYWLKW